MAIGNIKYSTQKVTRKRTCEIDMDFCYFNVGYCKPTIIRNDFISRYTLIKLVRGVTYLCDKVLSTLTFFITTVLQILVSGEKYSRQ